MLSVPKFIAIIVGSLFIAIGINFFLAPFKILDGGLIGISLILNYLWGTQVGLMLIVCSLPILIIAWRRNNLLVHNSIYGMLISSLMIDLSAPLQYHFSYYISISPFTSSIIGGLLIGTGIGVMLKYESSTGGTDLLAHFLTQWTTFNVGVLIFILDVLIIGVGGLIISIETFYYSFLTVTAGGIATSWLMMNKPLLDSTQPSRPFSRK